MELKDLLSLYFERSNAANSLWGFYITVVLGLLAYFGTAVASRQKVLLAVIVSLGFVGFAYVNANAIIEVGRARQATAKLITTYRDPDQTNQSSLDELKKSVSPSSTRGIMQFHIASDIMVLIGVWVLTLCRR